MSIESKGIPLLAIAFAVVLTGCEAQTGTTRSAFVEVGEQRKDGWISLFNGRNLTGWSPKFTGVPVGENYLNTFYASNGILGVSYDNHTTFDNKFGHLFYQQPYSHYILRAEYRFIGEQVANGPEWAQRNNGFMLHAQKPDTMSFEQNFPTSIEAQLLGGLGTEERPTGNMCSVATHVVLDGELRTEHCIISNSLTYHGDQWVEVELEVHGGDRIIHRINGETVFEYTNVQFDPNEAQDLIAKYGTLSLSSGYIAIQAESHPTQFRNIRLKPLGKQKLMVERN